MPVVKWLRDSEKHRLLLNLQSYYLHTSKLIRQQPCGTILYRLFSYEEFQFLRSEYLQEVYRSEFSLIPRLDTINLVTQWKHCSYFVRVKYLNTRIMSTET